MSEPIFNMEKVVIPGTGSFVPTIDPTGGTFVEGTKATITGLLADSSTPITLKLKTGEHPQVWESISEIRPSSAVVYVMAP